MKPHAPLAAVLAAFLATAFSACSTSLHDGTAYPPAIGEGGAFVRYGDFCYRIGGVLAKESATGPVPPYTADVWMVPLSALTARPSGEDDAGREGWVRQIPLPRPLAWAYAFTAGKLLYVVGGEDASGPLDAIYYTYIQADGTLGFSSGSWIRNARPLPYPLSRTTGFFHDGRVFLAGGRSTGAGCAGEGALGSIVQARVWKDGQIGQWNVSPARLSTGRMMAAGAIAGDRLLVAGGMADGASLASVESFSASADGLLAASAPGEPDLPEPLSAPIIAPSGESLYIFGGKADGGYRANVYRKDGSALYLRQWGLDAPAAGPGGFTTGGALWYLRSPASGAPGSVGRIQGLFLPSPAPAVLPGSGGVGANQPVTAVPEPGVDVRYRILAEGAEPPAFLDATDPILDTTEINLRLTASARMAFQGFAGSGPVSPVAYRDYRYISNGFFTIKQGNLSIGAPTDPLRTIRLEEVYTDGSTKNQAGVLYAFTVPPELAYVPLTLSWADKASSGGEAYTGLIELSLFESDLLTWALDAAGTPVHALASPASPVHLALGAGTWYVRAKSLQPVPAGEPDTFGIKVSRE